MSQWRVRLTTGVPQALPTEHGVGTLTIAGAFL